MNHIHSYQSNGWLICNCIILNSHNRSDCRQIAGCSLNIHTPAKAALSSTRVLSMQGFALFHAYFAGRCNNQSIHPAAVAHSTRLTYFLTALSLAYGWLDANHKSVSLVLLGKPLDGGSRKRGTNCGQFVLLSTSGEVSLLSGRHKFAVGKPCSSFVTSWGCFSPEPQQISWAIFLCFCHLGGCILPCCALITMLDARYLTCLGRLNSMLAVLIVVSSFFDFWFYFIFYLTFLGVLNGTS